MDGQMLDRIIPIHPSGSEDLSQTSAKLAQIRAVLSTEYSKKHSQPWVIAYSGGKDSSLLLQLVLEVVLSLPPEQRRRHVHIVGNDTLVESPLVIEHFKNSLATIRKSASKLNLPVTITITEPYADQTFWVNVVGRGYIPPTRNFRWCTDRLKIMPTSDFIEGLTRTHRHTVLLIGSRKAESASRRRRMDGHARGQRMNPHSQIKNCRVFAPIAELTDNEVWTILLQSRPPWGGTHRNLITLYRNAGGGECPLVLSKSDAPSCGTTSPRFGCWTCTVITKDRSLGGLIDSGYENLEPLYDFREWLIHLRENPSNRMSVRRNGTAKYRDDGKRVLGPFTINTRQKILQRLRHLEKETDMKLLTNIEEQLIRDIWRIDEQLYECRDALMQVVVGGAVAAA